MPNDETRSPTAAEAGAGDAGAGRGMRLGIIALALIAAAATLSVARALFLPVVLAILLALLLNPAMILADRCRLPRWLGALLVVVATVAAVVAAIGQLATPSDQWLNPRSAEWRKLESRLRALERPFAQIQGAQERVQGIADPPGPAKPKEVVVERRSLYALAGDATPVLVGALSTIVLLYFLLASGDLFLRKLIRVLPRLTDKKTAVGIARTIQVEIGRYFFTIASINLGLGVVTAVAMWLLGMPSPVFWGALAALLNFVPYVGPGTSLVLLTAAAFVSFDDWASIAAVPATFFALVLVEGQLIQPVLVGRRLQLNVVVTFLTVLAWGWLWGLGGVFVAVPTLVVLKICADHIEALAPLGEFLSYD